MVTAADLEGVWRLVGEEFVAPDGSVRSVPADDRFGKLIYGRGGHINVVSGPLGRPLPRETQPRMDLNDFAAAERAELAEDCVMYSGRYSVADGVVSHHIEYSINPCRVGTTATRRIELDGDDLALVPPQSPDGTQQRIKWRRAEAE